MLRVANLFIAVVAGVFIGAGLIALRKTDAVQRAVGLRPEQLSVKTPEQVRDLVRLTGAGFVAVGVGTLLLTLIN